MRNLLFLLLILPSLIFSSPILKNNGIVVSEQRIASDIGASILKEGGNAIDAAVAVGYALAVVDPCCGNIGGGGFMNIHLADGRNIILNFREKAPLLANKNMFSKLDTPVDGSIKGYLSVATPGTVLGLDTALQKYGTFSRKKVMAPAIQLAEKGFIITPYEAARYQKYAKDFAKEPNVSSIFLSNGKVLHAGDRLVQKDLANTLRQIADFGAHAFYHGSIAHKIVAASKANGGILTLKDFAKYRVKFQQPLICYYHEYTLVLPPPPSSGGIVLCEMLNILENFPLSKMGFHTSQSSRTIVEAMRYGFYDRNNRLGDPDFVHNPIDLLISKPYAKKISDIIKQSNNPPPHKVIQFEKELTDTTHYSVVDKKGNAVAVTYTLNGFFGSLVIAGDTGFFLNDEMDDFATKIGEANKFGLIEYDANAIAPGKQPLSSMTPTLAFKNNQLYLITGSPGGPRIITSVLLHLLNLFDYHLSLQDSIYKPRFHYQGEPDRIDLEPHALPLAVQQQMQKWGYHFQPQDQWGAIEAIKCNGDECEGANDIRRPDGGVGALKS